MLESHKGQEHRFVSETCETNTLSKKLITSEFDNISKIFAERLHRIEKKSQERFKGFTSLRKGSLLISHIELYNETYILFFKIDHAGFLDENFDWKVGLPEKQRAQKSAILKFIDAEADQIWVGDSNAKISEYWRDDFLDLTPLSSPEINTKTAFNAIDQLLNKDIRQISNSDYWTLRNAVVSHFRTNQHCLFNDLVDQVFGAYLPDNKEIQIDKIAEKARNLPSTHKFDPQFDIDSRAIRARIKKQITLAENLELRITGEIQNITKIFHADEETDGRKYLKIYSDAGYEEFHKKEQ